MNFVDSLVLVSNNEGEFQKKLIQIREELKNSKDTNKKVKSLIKSVNKYCKDRVAENNDKEIYILEADDFCMFTLDRLFKKTEDKFEIKKQAILNMLHQKTLPRDAKNAIEDQITEEIFAIIDICFPESTRYIVEKNNNPKKNAFLELIYKVLSDNFSYKIVNEITDKKPIVFIAEKGAATNITKLSILLREMSIDKLKNNANKELSDFCIKVNAGLAQCAVVTLLEDILTTSDVEYLCDKYKLNVNDLDTAIGQELYQCISDSSHEYSDLLKEAVDLSRKRQTFDDKVEQWIYRMGELRFK